MCRCNIVAPLTSSISAEARKFFTSVSARKSSTSSWTRRVVGPVTQNNHSKYEKGAENSDRESTGNYHDFNVCLDTVVVSHAVFRLQNTVQ